MPYPDDFKGVLPGEEETVADDDLAEAIGDAFAVIEQLGGELAIVSKAIIRIERANNYGQTDGGHEGDVRALTERLREMAATAEAIARDAGRAVR